MTIAMKCIMAGLGAEEAYRAIIKQIISSVGEEAIETILQSLLANQQEKIRKEVENNSETCHTHGNPVGKSETSVEQIVNREGTQKPKNKKHRQQRKTVRL